VAVAADGPVETFPVGCCAAPVAVAVTAAAFVNDPVETVALLAVPVPDAADGVGATLTAG
jgi:hypothetical protein